jgi:hypothetical protein
MGPIDYPQTSVKNRHYTLRNFPEERNLIYFAAEGWNHAKYVALLYELKNHNRVLIFL